MPTSPAARSLPLVAGMPLAIGWAELTPHRGYLVSYARRRLHDPALAEDLVHDVFEAVISGGKLAMPVIRRRLEALGVEPLTVH